MVFLDSGGSLTRADKFSYYELLVISPPTDLMSQGNRNPEMVLVLMAIDVEAFVTTHR